MWLPPVLYEEDRRKTFEGEASMGISNKICPSCGRKMKQQLIGLQHCNCGISWMRDIGYFQRTRDMVFTLKRVHNGKKVKQVPTIQYKTKNGE